MDIIVTGASRGIGREMVKILAGEGHRVLACARSGKKLFELQAEVGEAAQIIPLAVDLGVSDSYGAVAITVKQLELNPMVLINNAGYLVNKPFEELHANDFEQTFNINVKAVFLLVQALLPFMPKGAHIVNIGSMGGYQGSAKFPGLALYSAAKGALAILTECLAEELKASGIKANCLALGAAQTDMLAEAFPGYKAPLSAAEMAGFIADFSLHGSKYFNGKILPVSVSTP